MRSERTPDKEWRAECASMSGCNIGGKGRILASEFKPSEIANVLGEIINEIVLAAVRIVGNSDDVAQSFPWT